jgi:hypothetical protein
MFLFTSTKKINKHQFSYPRIPTAGKYWTLTFTCTAIWMTTIPSFSAPVAILSPDGRLKAEITDSGGDIRYTISLDGQQVLAQFAVGIQSDEVHYGQDAILGTAVLTRLWPS